jgi:hypothetical protein
LGDETSIASLNASTNAHVGEPGFYGNDVCCKKETSASKYSNVGQNVSEPVPSTSAVELYAYWTDNGKISHAILSTNETGDWENKTSYGSPMSISTNESWSNFTWSNSSVLGGSVVGWKIYTNDTCGNWNVTEINTFEIELISIEISQEISEGILFTNLEGSLTNQQEDVNITTWNNATWNYNNTPSPGSNQTEYWIKNTGNVNHDFCMKADSDLSCNQGSCSGSTISIDNVGWSNSTANNKTHPVYDTTKKMDTSYVKVGYGVQPNDYIYLRFWLYVPAGKPSGIYNTTYSIRGVEEGTGC